MMQLNLAKMGYLPKARKQNWKAVFLVEVDLA